MELKKLNKLLVDQYVSAGSMGTPESQLIELAGHFCDKIRTRVASNPMAPVPALIRLAKDNCREVRLAVAANPASPRALQSQLVHDGDPLLRYELACDVDLPRWMLEMLSADKIAWVRQEAVKTLALVMPEKYGSPDVPASKTGRPCIDICNPWWRKAVFNHSSS